MACLAWALLRCNLAGTVHTRFHLCRLTPHSIHRTTTCAQMCLTTLKEISLSCNNGLVKKGFNLIARTRRLLFLPSFLRTVERVHKVSACHLSRKLRCLTGELISMDLTRSEFLKTCFSRSPSRAVISHRTVS